MNVPPAVIALMLKDGLQVPTTGNPSESVPQLEVVSAINAQVWKSALK